MRLTIDITKEEQQAIIDYNEITDEVGRVSSPLPRDTIFKKLAEAYRNAVKSKN